jgi:deoxyribose-phosphate aldolase
LKQFQPCSYFQDREHLLSMIDNTNLSPTLTLDEAEDFVIRTFEEGFYCAMLPPHHTVILADRGYGRHGRLCTVYCFPHPYYSTDSCVRGLKTLLRVSIPEVDVVAPLHLVKSGEWGLVEDHLQSIIDVIHEAGSTGKLILEASILEDGELELLIEKAAKVGFDWVKTSTGVIAKGGDPYTVHRVASIARQYKLPVKAAGGIRTIYDAAAAVGAGARRLGTSSGFRILEQYDSHCGRG